MSATGFEAAYAYLPRWIRAIRWRELYKRQLDKQKFYCYSLYPPLFLGYYLTTNVAAQEILRKKPQTDEEREQIKRTWIAHDAFRDYEVDMYHVGLPPIYDLWERRKKYPEHYGDRYNTFKRYGPSPTAFYNNMDKPIYQ